MQEKNGSAGFLRGKMQDINHCVRNKNRNFSRKKNSKWIKKPGLYGMLCEINKNEIFEKREFVQKAGVAVSAVKIAKKC